MEIKFGLIKTSTDAHTLGINYIAENLKACGYDVLIGNREIEKALDEISNEQNAEKIITWINEHRITTLSISYRLDPENGLNIVGRLVHNLKKHSLFHFQGGCLKKICFAGLPKTCELIKKQFNGLIITFKGGETLSETLKIMGVPNEKIPTSIKEGNKYDEDLMKYGLSIVNKQKYLNYNTVNKYDYPEYGSDKDSVINRIKNSKKKGFGPIIRVHAGPYNSQLNRKESVEEFIQWCKTLADSKLLDVLSIGSSQLTQSHFGENWDGLNNGGGVPINSEVEYYQIYTAAKPMLVRTYSGTKNVREMAEMYEKIINISWHALSLWWFNKLDGRGPNGLLENLVEHFEALEYIAQTGKPFEPNVPHHFAFRGSDDLTYIISGYLAVKAAKLKGVRSVIVQNMLNTPKTTWAIKDLAKSRAMMKLIRSLESPNFNVYLQTRAGLDYFSPNLVKAKIQLAAVTALMDDIEPDNPNSPEIIHVVSYSEASYLATPNVIQESIKITNYTLQNYREMKRQGINLVAKYEDEILQREKILIEKAKKVIESIEKNVINPYSPKGFYEIFKSGYLVTPYLWGEESEKFPNAKKWNTKVVEGAIEVTDNNGRLITVEQIIEFAENNYRLYSSNSTLDYFK